MTLVRFYTTQKQEDGKSMCKWYGYVRISTVKQSIKRQIENIQKLYPDAVIVTDEYTGTKLDRPGWTKLYKAVKEGDTIIFDEVSRMSRDADEGFAVYEDLYRRGVNLIFIKEPHINTETYKKAMESGVQMTGTDVDCILEGINKYMLRLAKKQIKLAFEQAEKEADFLRQRTREGIREGKKRNERIDLGLETGEKRQYGQVKGSKLTTKKSIAAKELIRKHSKDFGGTLEDPEVIKLIGCSRNSFYKYKREAREEV